MTDYQYARLLEQRLEKIMAPGGMTNILRVADGTPLRLDEKPATLDNWERVDFSGRDCIEGNVYGGHPTARDGERLRTSSIIYIVLEGDKPFVITALAWYYLGKPKAPINVAVQQPPS